MISEMVISSSIGEIRLRPFKKKDVEAQLSYLYDSPVEFLETIGFATKNFPGRAQHKIQILERLAISLIKKKCNSIVGEYKNKTIAVVHIHVSPEPHAHFHIFDPKMRGKGIGAQIFKGGLKMLMAHHNLDKLYVEPKTDNGPMNRLMEKCGFKFVENSFYKGATTTSFPAKKYLVSLQNLE